MSNSAWNSNALWSGEASNPASSTSWATPGAIFKPLDEEFQFELDAAADPRNTKCPYWFGISDDALAQDWSAPTSYGSNAIEDESWPGPPWERVWVNPPYGRHVGKWVKKAFDESRKGITVVMLLMASTDTHWWHDYVSKATQVRLIRGRLAFIRNDGHTGPAPKGSAVVVFAPWWSGPPQYVHWSP